MVTDVASVGADSGAHTQAAAEPARFYQSASCPYQCVREWK